MTDLLYYYTQGGTLSKRFYDAINEEIDTRDAETIIQETVEKAGLVIE